MLIETRSLESPDGVKLFVRIYSPDRAIPSRTLYWVHGVGEHGGRHSHVAEVLVQRGWRMIVADLRGHGRSTGVPTHVSSFDDYVNDIDLIWKQLGLHEISPVLLGHSMGGLVAVRAVQSGRIRPSSLVLSSPLLGLKLRVNPLSLFLGHILIRFIPTARFSNGIDPANMTRDSEFAAMRRSDTLINKTVTAGWFFAMQEALAAARREAAKVELPVFALQGSLDRTTDPVAVADWWERIRSADKCFLVLEDHFHELFFEPDWQETTIQVLGWLENENRMILSQKTHELDEPDSVNPDRR